MSDKEPTCGNCKHCPNYKEKSADDVRLCMYFGMQWLDVTAYVNGGRHPDCQLVAEGKQS